MLKRKDYENICFQKQKFILPGFEVGTILTPVSFNAKRSIDCSNLLYSISSNGKNPAN